MTAPGSDKWFGSALSGADGTADPVVRQRPDQVWSDPTAAIPDKAAIAPNDLIVLPALQLAADRAQIERMLDDDQLVQAPPRPPAPVRPPPPRPTASQVVRRPPPPQQQRPLPPPPNPQNRSPWSGAGLPAPINNFLNGLQQQSRPPAARPPQPARKANAAASWVTVLIVIGAILLFTGAGEDLVHLFQEIFGR